MNLIQQFMRVFFSLLYHPFASAYDLVAAVVSFGRWKDWTQSVIPFISGTRILELGHGPGHLQRSLLDLKFAPVAIDESAQMGTLAKRRLGASFKLARSLAQHLPFANDSFDCVISTFPTDYIFQPQTLSEIRRCLSDGGRLIVLPAVWPKNNFLKWLFQVTGQARTEGQTSIREKMQGIFITAGYHVKNEIVELQSGTLMFIVAKK